MKNSSEDMVTKKEFRFAMKKLDGRFQDIDKRFDGIGGKFEDIDKRFEVTDKRFQGIDERLDKSFRLINTRFENIEGVLEDIKANMYTKQDHARDLIWMDKAMAEIEAAREERILSGRQRLRIDDLVFDHEKRIRVLENK